MKTIALIFLFTATLSVACAAPASRDSAEHLVDLMNPGGGSGPLARQMFQLQLAVNREMLPRGTSLEQRNQAYAFWSKMADWPAIRDFYADVFQQTFTQEEVDGLAAFYSSPAGRAFAAKQGVLLENVDEQINDRLGPLMGKLRGLVDEALQNAGEDPKATIAELTKVIGTNPRAVLPYIGRGDAEVAQDDDRAALADYRRAIALDPRCDAAYCGCGQAQSGAFDYAGAVESFSRAIALNPDNIDAWNGRGEARDNALDMDGAVADFDHALEIDPRSAEAYSGRGDAEDNKKHFNEAIADYNRALKIAPADINALDGRGQTKSDALDFDGAIADFTAALADDSRDSQAYQGRACARYMKGDAQGAMADINEGVGVDPKSPGCYIIRGAFESGQGRMGPALADDDRAVALEPNYAENYASRGNTREMMGDYAGAAADYRRALDLFPHEDYVRFHLSFVLRRAHLGSGETTDMFANLAAWPDEWALSLGQFLGGDLSESDLFAEAAVGPDSRSRSHECEAFYYAGMEHLLEGDTATARQYFEKCRATGLLGYVEYQLAGVELGRLKP